MDDKPFAETVQEICARDPRFGEEAYFFTRDALDFTVKSLQKPRRGPGRHVSGAELLQGIREFTLQQFGPMALTVLKSWGITSTVDFGEIVFNLVESGKLGRTDEDRKEDFAGGYDFQEAFAKPFLPADPSMARSLSRRKGEKTSRRSGRHAQPDTKAAPPSHP